MIVCFCLQRNDKDVVKLINKHGVDFVVSQAKKEGCGSCISTIRNLELFKKKEV